MKNRIYFYLALVFLLSCNDETKNTSNKLESEQAEKFEEQKRNWALKVKSLENSSLKFIIYKQIDYPGSNLAPKVVEGVFYYDSLHDYIYIDLGIKNTGINGSPLLNVDGYHVTKEHKFIGANGNIYKYNFEATRNDVYWNLSLWVDNNNTLFFDVWLANDFVVQYEMKNFPTDKEIYSKEDESKAINLLGNLQEVIQLKMDIESNEEFQSELVYIVAEYPNNEHPNLFYIKVGEDFPDRYVTNFHFYVNISTNEIFVMDMVTGNLLSMDDYRRKYNN